MNILDIAAILAIWIIGSICSFGISILLYKIIELCYKFYRKFKKGDE